MARDHWCSLRNSTCGRAVEPAKKPASRTAKPGSEEAHNSRFGHGRHARSVRATNDLGFAARAACLPARRSRTKSLRGRTTAKLSANVTVRSSRGDRRPEPGLWLRAQWRPSTRRNATLSPPWDGDTEPRSGPWLSERYGRIAWYVRTSKLTIVCRYPIRGRSCRRDGWLKPDNNPTGIDRCGEDAGPTAPPRLDRTVTCANVLYGLMSSCSIRRI